MGQCRSKLNRSKEQRAAAKSSAQNTARFGNEQASLASIAAPITNKKSTLSIAGPPASLLNQTPAGAETSEPSPPAGEPLSQATTQSADTLPCIQNSAQESEDLSEDHIHSLGGSGQGTLVEKDQLSKVQTTDEIQPEVIAEDTTFALSASGNGLISSITEIPNSSGTSIEDTSTKDTSIEHSTEDAVTKDVTVKQTSTEDTVAQDPAAKEISANEESRGDTSSKDAATTDYSTEYTSAEDEDPLTQDDMTDDLYQSVISQLLGLHEMDLSPVYSTEPIILRRWLARSKKSANFENDKWHMSIIREILKDKCTPISGIPGIEWIINSNTAKRYYETKRTFAQLGKDTTNMYACHGTPPQNVEKFYPLDNIINLRIIAEGFKIGGQNGHTCFNGAAGVHPHNCRI
jgi:hypothetical protein